MVLWYNEYMTPSLKRQDIISILVLGEIVGASFFAIFNAQCADPAFHFFVCDLSQSVAQAFFFFGVPLVALFALLAAWVIALRVPVMLQIAKFLAVGVSNTSIDWGILNLLLIPLGLSTGLYALGKGISFGIATLNSFFWNKFWTFKHQDTKGLGRQMMLFYGLTAIGLGINVGAATLFKELGPDTRFWAGILAPGFATLISAVWDFLSYRFVVFKPRTMHQSES